jgi:hypothetical protein
MRSDVEENDSHELIRIHVKSQGAAQVHEGAVTDVYDDYCMVDGTIYLPLTILPKVLCWILGSLFFTLPCFL